MMLRRLTLYVFFYQFIGLEIVCNIVIFEQRGLDYKNGSAFEPASSAVLLFIVCGRYLTTRTQNHYATSTCRFGF
jgi:hypothetical protein